VFLAIVVLFAQTSSADIYVVCSEMQWRETPAECAAKAGLQDKWGYFTERVEEYRRQVGVQKPIKATLGVSYGHDWLAWSYPGYDGYGVSLDYRRLAKMSEVTLMNIAAHEVCHAVNGDLDLKISPLEQKQLNLRDSPQHMAVYRCARDLVGEWKYSQWLRQQYRMKRSDIIVHLIQLDWLRPRQK
jgi:hypothetical protein